MKKFISILLCVAMMVSCISVAAFAKEADDTPVILVPGFLQPYIYIEGEKTDKLLKTLDLANYATAENCFDAMVKKYKLEGYQKSEQRIIMGVRYSMDISDYSISLPFTFAVIIFLEFYIFLCKIKIIDIKSC